MTASGEGLSSVMRVTSSQIATIRRPAETDHDAIVAFIWRYLSAASPAHARLVEGRLDYLQRCIRNMTGDATNVVFMAERERAVIGVCAASMNRDLFSGEPYASCALWVLETLEPAAEEQRIPAVMLLRCVREWAVERGAQAVKAWAPDNSEADGFYRNVGFDRFEVVYEQRFAATSDSPERSVRVV